MRSLTPQWDLALVLRALGKPPFEPLAQAPLRLLSLKTALLLALTSAKRVSDLCALSVSPSCLSIRGDGSAATLQPNPSFTPKILTNSFRSRVFSLQGFFPPPHNNDAEEASHRLCPVRALSQYVLRTAAIRRTQQLFVHYREHSQGAALSKQRLSHWLCEAITQAYNTEGTVPPQGIRAHSTRALSASTALFRGMSVAEICAAASWASPCPFIRFYLRDVSEPSLTHSVLSSHNDDLGPVVCIIVYIMYICICFCHYYTITTCAALCFLMPPPLPPPHSGCLGGTRASHNYQSCISLINHARLHSRLGLSAS